MDKKQHPKQIRIEPELYEKAVIAAKRAGLNFSAYVRNLIARDVGGSN